MATSSSLLIRLESLGLSLRHRLVQLSLTRLVDSPRLGIESSGIVTESLVLLIFGTACALETDARFARALGSVVSTFFRRNVLRVGSSASLTGAPDADGSTRETFEARLVDTGLFGCHRGLGVERVFESAVGLVVQIAELWQ